MNHTLLCSIFGKPTTRVSPASTLNYHPPNHPATEASGFISEIFRPNYKDRFVGPILTEKSIRVKFVHATFF